MTGSGRLQSSLVMATLGERVARNGKFPPELRRPCSVGTLFPIVIGEGATTDIHGLQETFRKCSCSPSQAVLHDKVISV